MSATPPVVHLSRGREWRGGERQVRLLVRALVGAGARTQHVVTDRGSPLARALAADGLPVHGVGWRAGFDPRAAVGLARLLHALRPLRPVLHAHDSHALLLGWLAARSARVPLIATRRSLSPPGPLWRRPDRVIAISRAVEARLAAAGIPAERICRIASGVDRAGPRPEPERPEPDAGPVVLAVGALSPEKGHATLLEAFARIARHRPDAVLLLAGDGPERASLERRVRRLGLQHRVRFLGPREDARPLMRGADVLVQPSHREALGTALLEALSLGVPVVATDSGGPAELLADQAGLLVPPGDPDAMARAIERVLEDPALRQALAAAGPRNAARYDAAGMADQITQVYRSVHRAP